MGGNFVHKDDEDTPTNQVFACQFDDRDLMVQFETRNWYTNSEAGMGIEYPFVDHRNVVGVIFLGTEGYMIIPDYSSYHVFLGSDRKPGPSASVPGNPMMDTDHFRNWIQAHPQPQAAAICTPRLKKGTFPRPCATWPTSAYRTGRTLRFDPKTERFLDDPEADKLLTRPYRAPYVVPEQV